MSEIGDLLSELSGKQKCPKCQALVGAQALFCSNCGASVASGGTFVCPIDGKVKTGKFCDTHTGVGGQVGMPLIPQDDYALLRYLIDGPRRMSLESALAVVQDTAKKTSLKHEMQKGGGSSRSGNFRGPSGSTLGE